MTRIRPYRNLDIGRDTEWTEQPLKDLVLIYDNSIAALKQRAHGQIVPAAGFQDITVIGRVIDSAAELKLAHRTMFWSGLDLKVCRRRSLVQPWNEANLRIEVSSYVQI